MTFPFEVLTAEAPVASGEADFMVVPGREGDFGVLMGHSPVLTALRPGELKLVVDGATEYYFVVGGFVQVLPDKVVVLADTAERADLIDAEKATEARDRAKAVMDSLQGRAGAAAVVERESARLRVHELRRHHRIHHQGAGQPVGGSITDGQSQDG